MVRINRAGIKFQFMLKFLYQKETVNKMHKITFGLMAIAALGMGSGARADYGRRQFRNEVLEGIDVHVARTTVDTVDDAAIGAVGGEVYASRHSAADNNVTIYIPTTMYVRGGAGMTLGALSDRAKLDGYTFDIADTWTVQLGLGWNLSSYVRAEIDFQNTTFLFEDLGDLGAASRQVGGTLYFDLLRRWYRTGDITRRRLFVPFIGFGAGAGTYEFQGPGGADGFFVAPRAIAGFNIMITDLIGIDLAWQYQMRIGHGFGWNVRDGGVDNINNVMVTLRANF